MQTWLASLSVSIIAGESIHSGPSYFSYWENIAVHGNKFIIIYHLNASLGPTMLDYIHDITAIMVSEVHEISYMTR